MPHTLDLPVNMQFPLIIADPPWSFKTFSDKGKGRSPEQHYQCMTLQDIKNLPVSQMAEPDCALLLWVTDPFLKLGLDVMEAWGFKYKTVGFNWAKKCRVSQDKWHTGQGYYTRANPELCLLGTRGAPKRADKGINKLVVAPVREHSRKPDGIYDDARRLFGLQEGRLSLELFARTDRGPDWLCWGNELKF